MVQFDLPVDHPSVSAHYDRPPVVEQYCGTVCRITEDGRLIDFLDAFGRAIQLSLTTGSSVTWESSSSSSLSTGPFVYQIGTTGYIG